MVIIKKEKKGDVTYYHVDKNMTDEVANRTLHQTFVKPAMIDLLIKDNANVYDKDGNLLLLFRKKKLSKEKADQFYDSTFEFATTKWSSNRGSATGIKSNSNVLTNPRVYSNIIGFFDKMGIYNRHVLKLKNIKLKTGIRETSFNTLYPELFKKSIPFIKEINDLYKKYVPDKYNAQLKKAKEIPGPFKIDGTVFTTITINVNYQTAIHKDKGDDVNGFGNLAVIEDGEYTGGETCFPQYGIGVDVRTGDILFMNVHEWHGNLATKLLTPDAKRMSIVSYLRDQIWHKSRNMSNEHATRHLKRVRTALKPSNKTRRNTKRTT